MRYRISTYVDLTAGNLQPAAVFYFILEGREGEAYALEVAAEPSLFERCNLRDPAEVTKALSLLARQEFLVRLYSGTLQRHQRCIWQDDEPTAQMVAALELAGAELQINTWLNAEEPTDA